MRGTPLIDLMAMVASPNLVAYWLDVFRFPVFRLKTTLDGLETFGFGYFLRGYSFGPLPLGLLAVAYAIFGPPTYPDEAIYILFQVLLFAPWGIAASFALYSFVLPHSLRLVGAVRAPESVESAYGSRSSADLDKELSSREQAWQEWERQKRRIRSCVWLSSSMWLGLALIVFVLAFLLEVGLRIRESETVAIVASLVGLLWLRSAHVILAATISASIWRIVLGSVGLFLLLYFGIGLPIALIDNLRL